MSEWSDAHQAACVRIRDGIARVLQRANDLARSNLFDARPPNRFDVALGQAPPPAAAWFELGRELSTLSSDAFRFLETGVGCGWEALDYLADPDPSQKNPACFGPAIFAETLQLIRVFKALRVQYHVAHKAGDQCAFALRSACKAMHGGAPPADVAAADHFAAALRQALDRRVRLVIVVREVPEGARVAVALQLQPDCTPA